MAILNKNNEPLVSFILTEYGKKQMSIGRMSFDYYAFGDSDIDYSTVDINSLTLKPSPSITDLKYPIYKSNNTIFYPLTDELIESKEIPTTKTNEFKVYNNNSGVITLDPKFIKNYGNVKNTENPYIINVEFDDIITKDDVVAFDFITFFLDEEFKIVENHPLDIIRCQIDNITIEGKNAKIYLKQPVKLNLNDYRFFITPFKLIFEDQQVWNQIFCGGEQLSNHEKRFAGIKEYFEAKNSLLIYQNKPISQDDFNNIATNEATLTIPNIIWDKSPVPKMGVNLKTTNQINNLTSQINQEFTSPGINLVDDYNNVVGLYYPQHKLFNITDIELATTLADKNNRNWTLPEINYEYIPSNGNGVFNKTDDDLYITYQLKGGLHTNTSYCRKILHIPNKKGDYQINLDFTNFKLALLSNIPWKINEISILFQYVKPNEILNPNQWKEITMLKGDNLTIENIKAKYGVNIQHLNRGTDYIYESPRNMDEQPFIGNVKYNDITKRYITIFNFQSDSNKILYTRNPSYVKNTDIRVSEVAVYDNQYKVVAYAKLSHSIKWRPDITFAIKTKMIF